LWCFGNNANGQLGLGNTTNQTTPTKLPFFSAKNVVSSCCGVNHSIVLCDDGLYSFGNNGNGQLGLGNTTQQLTPTKITFFNGKNVIGVACGMNHSIVLCDDGLYGFGYNQYGELGLGNKNTPVVTPTKMNFFNGKNVLSVFGCAYHSIVLCDDGLYSVGWGGYGSLGTGSTSDTYTPAKVSFFNGKNIQAICCGYYHSIVLCDDGLYGFGYGGNGQLGLGNTTQQATPTKITFFNGKNVIGVACGMNHSIVLCDDGLYGFGSNGNGELGLGNRTQQATPTKINFFNGKRIICMSAFANHSFVLCDDGLYGFGLSNSGELGSGNTTNAATPIKLPHSLI